MEVAQEKELHYRTKKEESAEILSGCFRINKQDMETNFGQWQVFKNSRSLTPEHNLPTLQTRAAWPIWRQIFKIYCGQDWRKAFIKW